MKQKMTTIILIITLYLFFLCDFKATYKTNKKEVEIEYNGLLWVCLDYWSIKKHKSNDMPIKWLKVNIKNK